MNKIDFTNEDLKFFYEQIVSVAKQCFLKKVTICDDVYFDIEKEEIVNKKINDDKNHSSISSLDSDLVFSITNKIYKSLTVERLYRPLRLELLSKENDFNGQSYCLMKASLQYGHSIYFTYSYTKSSLGLDPICVRVYSFNELQKGEPGFFVDFENLCLNIKDLLIFLYVSSQLSYTISKDRYIEILIENYYPASKNLED